MRYRRSKYGVRTDREGIEARTVDNIVFHSVREAQEYIKLRGLLRTGYLTRLERQVKYPLCAWDQHGNEAVISHWVADFVVQDKDGKTHIYDAKGFKTPAYKVAKKWFEHQYGLRIVEL